MATELQLLFDAAESIYDGWFSESAQIDWDNFIDRLEDQGFDMGDDMLSSRIKAVKRHIRAYRRIK